MSSNPPNDDYLLIQKVSDTPFLSSLPPEDRADLPSKDLIASLLKEISTLATVAACTLFFDSINFQHCLNTLRIAQQTHVDSEKDKDPMKLRMAWAESWAKEASKRNHADPRAMYYDNLRKLVKALLMRVCDLTFDKPPKGTFSIIFKPDGEKQLLEIFEKRRIIAIMTNTIPMDKANALYNMVDEATGEKGLFWCSEYDQNINLPKTMFPTINKRFKWLMGVPGLCDELPHFQEWLEPAVPEGYESALAADEEK